MWFHNPPSPIPAYRQAGMEKGVLSCTTRGAGQNPEPYMVQGRIKDLKIDKGRFMKSYLVLLVVLILIGFLSFDSAFPQAGIKEMVQKDE